MKELFRHSDDVIHADAMISFVPSPRYRTDIDGMRAIAVLAVIAFHFGQLANGYLGVDVFFVISGFLITGIIYREVNESRFSIVNFYMRRTRRIIPLVSFICVVALGLGMVFMLPDDLENLAQSVIATNLFSNNILQAITTRDYWDVVNEYKPLMHTWSLAIEEQYYVLYPFLFLAMGKKYIGSAPAILSTLALISLALFLLPASEHARFYYLPYRFFELAIGGVLAILLNGRMIRHGLGAVLTILLIGLLTVPIPYLSANWLLVLVVIVTAAVLGTSNIDDGFCRGLLTNPVAVFFGKISFSLYMWHQLILAFARYFVLPEMTFISLTVILILTVILSVMTYLLIECPFRDKKKIQTFWLLFILGAVFVITNLTSLYIYNNAGVLRDVPELGITKNSVERGMHARYNSRIHSYDRPFTESPRTKVLVVGNSFARDWANVLLESSHRDAIEISYVVANQHAKLAERAEQAELIFVSTADRDWVQSQQLDESKLWSVGTKNFGHSNGYFYNNRGEYYCEQRTELEEGYLERNERLKNQFPDRYLDLIAAVIDSDHTVPVFTPACQFISQDCRHFTIFGARFYASLFDEKIGEIIQSADSSLPSPPLNE